MKSKHCKWLKITAWVNNSQDRKEAIRKMVRCFESDFRVRHLYYARYCTLEESRFELSAFTEITDSVIKRFFKRFKEVTRVEIIERGTGSLAHAYGYQAVKNLDAFVTDQANDDQFLDLLHWMANMRGLDYLREARLFSYRALCLTHQVAIESDKNVEIVREFGKKFRHVTAARALATRLNLAGKGREWDKASTRAAQSKPKLSARVASDKSKALKRRLRNVGLNHR